MEFHARQLNNSGIWWCISLSKTSLPRLCSPRPPPDAAPHAAQAIRHKERERRGGGGVNNTRTAPLKFMSHLRALKSPRRMTVASGGARAAAHLAGDSPRQGAHGGRLGVSKHDSFLLTGEPLANGEAPGGRGA